MKKYMIIILCIFLSNQVGALEIWPGASAPCNTTLQACIDGSPVGEYIEIRTNSIIDESVFASSAVSLVAGHGYKPQLAEGRNVTVHSNSPDTVTIKGLTLLNGKISFSTIGQVMTANFISNNVTLNNSDSVALKVSIGTPASKTINIKYNTIIHEFNTTPTNITGAIMIDKHLGTGEVTGDIYGNTIYANGIETRGVVLNNSSDGEINMNVSGNEIKGATQAGIHVLSDSTTASLDVHLAHNSFNKENDFFFPSGILIDGQAGSIDAEIVNNTMVNSRTGIEVYENAGATVEAYIQNNIVAHAIRGFNYDVDATISSDYNLYFDNITNTNFTPGTNTLNVDPMFYSETNTRLRDSSPAVDSGNSLALFALGSTPLIDADGTNRLKRNITPNAVVDRGAYESGDHFFTHKTNGSGSHITIIDNPNTNNQNTADDIHITSNLSPNGSSAPSNNDNEAIYYAVGQWRIFNESTDTDIATNATFNVSKFGSVSNTFEHTATSGANLSTIDHAGLNGNIDKIVMMTQHWIGAYNPHPAGIFYGFGNWNIFNFDAAEIPINSQFNLYYQDESKSAWEHIAKSANISFDGTYLDNPLINDVPCAQIQVTQSGSQGFFNDRPVGVAFDSRSHVRKWGVVNQDASNMIENAAFYIMVNPAQIAACSDLIFKDGFE